MVSQLQSNKGHHVRLFAGKRNDDDQQKRQGEAFNIAPKGMCAMNERGSEKSNSIQREESRAFSMRNVNITQQKYLP